MASTRAPFLSTKYSAYYHSQVPKEDEELTRDRPRHARRRVFAPVLAAGVLWRRARRCTRRPEDSR